MWGAYAFNDLRLLSTTCSAQFSLCNDINYKILLLPLSWFIIPLSILCQILTIDLTKIIIMYVTKNYIIGFVFNIVSNDYMH